MLFSHCTFAKYNIISKHKEIAHGYFPLL
jgi:hypothetical protein